MYMLAMAGDCFTLKVLRREMKHLSFHIAVTRHRRAPVLITPYHDTTFTLRRLHTEPLPSDRAAIVASPPLTAALYVQFSAASVTGDSGVRQVCQCCCDRWLQFKHQRAIVFVLVVFLNQN